MTDTSTAAQPLNVTTQNASIDPVESTLTVNVEMKRGTEYGKEAKSASTFLKVGLPATAIIDDGVGGFMVAPQFQASVQSVTRQLLGVCEVAVAAQHGLGVQSDEHGVVQVLGLFPGATTTVAPGPLAAPAVAPAAAPVAPVAPVAAPATPAPQATGGYVEPFPGGAVATTPPAPAPQTPAPAPGGTAVPGTLGVVGENIKWMDSDKTRQEALAATVDAWLAQDGRVPAEAVTNRMLPTERYPGVDVAGTKIGAKNLKGNYMFSDRVKNWAVSLVASGQVTIPS